MKILKNIAIGLIILGIIKGAVGYYRQNGGGEVKGLLESLIGGIADLTIFIIPTVIDFAHSVGI